MTGDDLPVVFLARGRLSICVGKGRVDGTGFVAAPVPHSLLARNQKMNVSSFTHAGRGNAIASSPLEPPQAITGGGRGVGTTAAAQRCRGQGVVHGGELNPMFGRRVRDATVIGNRAGASGRAGQRPLSVPIPPRWRPQTSRALSATPERWFGQCANRWPPVPARTRSTAAEFSADGRMALRTEEIDAARHGEGRPT